MRLIVSLGFMAAALLVAPGALAQQPPVESLIQQGRGMLSVQDTEPCRSMRRRLEPLYQRTKRQLEPHRRELVDLVTRERERIRALRINGISTLDWLEQASRILHSSIHPRPENEIELYRLFTAVLARSGTSQFASTIASCRSGYRSIPNEFSCIHNSFHGRRDISADIQRWEQSHAGVELFVTSIAVRGRYSYETELAACFFAGHSGQICANIRWADPEHIRVHSDVESLDSFIAQSSLTEAANYRQQCSSPAAPPQSSAPPASDVADSAAE